MEHRAKGRNTIESRGKINSAPRAKRGRPYCFITKMFIGEGLSPSEAIVEAHRFRARLNVKYIPVSMLTYAEHEKRKDYNRRWMAAFRLRERLSKR